MSTTTWTRKASPRDVYCSLTHWFGLGEGRRSPRPWRPHPSWADVWCFQLILEKSDELKDAHSMDPATCSPICLPGWAPLWPWADDSHANSPPARPASSSNPASEDLTRGRARCWGGSQQRKASKTHAPESGVTPRRYRVQPPCTWDPSHLSLLWVLKVWRSSRCPQHELDFLLSVSVPAARWAVSLLRRNRAWRRAGYHVL